jgi:hypothetical protein
MLMAGNTLSEKRAVWSADQMLAWYLVKRPLEWRAWPEDMLRELPRAQLELRQELGDKKRKAWGIRPGSQGSMEQISDKLFRLEFPVVVDPGGYLRTLHPRDQPKFREFKDGYGVPEWRAVEFDSGETALPGRSIVPFHSGGPGRPTAIDVVIAEGKRRIEAGEVTPTPKGLTKFAEALCGWWEAERLTYTPVAPSAGVSTICNGLRELWRSKLPPQPPPDR